MFCFVLLFCSLSLSLQELRKLKSSSTNLHIVQLDVRDFPNYDKLYSQVNSIVGSNGLDLLINNAGIAQFKTLNQVTPNDMLESYEVNTVAPLLLTKTFLPLLKSSGKDEGSTKLIVNMGTTVASIEQNNQGGMYPYRASKVALNMISRSVATDLAKEGILCVSINPGWVKTDMGGKKAPMAVDQSVTKMLKTLSLVDKNSNGKMINFDGKIIPW